MNRKDMIIVAVLLNVIVLSALFVLAINSDDSQVGDGSDLAQEIVIENKLPTRLPQAPTLVVDRADPLQDNKFELIIGDLDSADNELLSRDEEWSMFAQRPETPDPRAYEEAVSDSIVEIIVKKGDSLDRIARANGTSVQSIRALNGLKNDHLKIGQILNVDVGSAKKNADQRTVTQNPPQQAPRRPVSAVAQADAVYYILKSGDSPWKVAKQFHVNMDDLLRLNQLDEEKARNLKVGDRLRVQ